MNKNRLHPERVPYFKIKNVPKLNETTEAIDLTSKLDQNKQLKSDLYSAHFQLTKNPSNTIEQKTLQLKNVQLNKDITSLKLKIEQLTNENQCLKYEKKEFVLKLLTSEEINTALTREKDELESLLSEKSKTITDLEEKLSNLNRKHSQLNSHSLLRNSIQFINKKRSKKRVKLFLS
jgi:chromosome segregation ATPase